MLMYGDVHCCIVHRTVDVVVRDSVVDSVVIVSVLIDKLSLTQIL